MEEWVIKRTTGDSNIQRDNWLGDDKGNDRATYQNTQRTIRKIKWKMLESVIRDQSGTITPGGSYTDDKHQYILGRGSKMTPNRSQTQESNKQLKGQQMTQRDNWLG